MADLKKKKEKIFASIAAAQTIASGLPGLVSDIYSFLSINSASGSIDFLKDLYVSLAGSDELINVISKLLVNELPAIELAIKTILKTNVRNMITCGINPLITDLLIKDGIWFDLSQIDINGYLQLNPLSEMGKHFYFGCDRKDGIEITSDLYKSIDMDAVIWYTVNKTTADNRRVVWDNSLSLSEEDRENPDKIKPVITMEYCENARDLTDIAGAQISLPGVTSNVLHIFLGDAVNFTDIKSNRYYKKFLIEFNFNYLDSIKLFDAKVLAAQIVSKLTGGITIGIGAKYSLSYQLIEYKVSKLVERIIEYDDVEIDDCFFTFSNDEYNDLLNKNDLQQAGLFSVNGEMNGSTYVNPEDILNQINGISEAASKEEQITILDGAFREIAATLSKTQYKDDYNFNFSVDMNFLLTLIKQVCTSIVCSIISPKVYLMLAINLKLMGYPGLPTLEEFFGSYRAFIASIIRLVRDLVLKFFYDEIMKILQPILNNVIVQFSIESVMFYKELIEQLLKCFSLFKGEEGTFNMDIVNYADITDGSQGTPPIQTC